MTAAETDCFEDRIVLARRGALDEASRRMLEEHLKGCADCHLFWLATQAFDKSGEAQVGDERLVERAVVAALARAGGEQDEAIRASRLVPAVGRRRRTGFGARRWAARPALVAASMILAAAAAASAGIFIHRHWPPAARVDGPAAPPKRAAHRTGHGQAGAHLTSDDLSREVVPEIPVEDRALPSPARQPERGALPPPPQALSLPTARAQPRPAGSAPKSLIARRPLEPPAAPEVVSPAEASPDHAAGVSTPEALFARATKARRLGRSADAIAAFQQLQREHPDSAEAVVSLVSVGELLTEASSLDLALASFDAYLRKSPSGALAAEALAGKVRVLRRWGREVEAERVRTELGRRFPQSPYAAPASRDGDP